MAFIKLISFCISRSTTVRADSAGIWSEVDKVEKLVDIPYSGKFSRVLIFAVFADRRQTAKFVTSKNNE